MNVKDTLCIGKTMTCDLCFVPAGYEFESGIFSGFLCNFSMKCDGLPTF